MTVNSIHIFTTGGSSLELELADKTKVTVKTPSNFKEDSGITIQSEYEKLFQLAEKYAA